MDLNPKLISVVANHLGDIRKGIMVLEDPALLEVVYGKLKQHVGRPLTEIGDLEISLLPPMPKRGPRQVRPPPRSLQVGGQITRQMVTTGSWTARGTVPNLKPSDPRTGNSLLQLLQQPGHIVRQVGDGLEALGVGGGVAGFEAVGDGPVAGTRHEHPHDAEP